MSKSAEVTALWAWNGDMSHEEIATQLSSFKQANISGVFLHSRAGLKVKYLEKEWFDAIEATILKAQELGINIYLYDEDGWPSGFAGGRVAAISEDYWSMPVRIVKECPKDGTVLISYKQNSDGSYVRDENGKDLFVVGFKSKYYVDLLNPECTDAFIRCTHEEYKKHFGKYFGNIIKGIFTDEPQLMLPYVYNRFIKQEYFKTYGENIDDSFYLLESNSLEGKQFRLRYFDVVGRLFYQNYSKKIGDWCEKNSIALTGHLPGEDGLCSFKYNMGIMSHYINFQSPGIDALGKRITSPVLMKQLESIKHQFNKDKVLCEVFGGCGWNTSFNTLKYIWSYNAAFGINNLCSHFSSYSIEGIRKRDYPAFFSYQEPWFDSYHELTKSFLNLSNFTQEGSSNNDVLVISPLLTVTSDMEYSDLAKATSTDYRNFLNNLLDEQVKFELTDETILEQYGNINECGLSIGQCSYKTIFLPSFEIIMDSTLNFIKKALKCGLNVCFVTKKPSYLLKDGKLSKLPNDIFDDIGLINNRIKIIDKYLLFIKYERNLEIRGGFSNFLVDQLIVNERKVGNDFYYLVMNTSEVSSKECSFKFNKKYAYVAYPQNGNFKGLPLTDSIGRLTLLPMETILIKASDNLLDTIPMISNNYMLQTVDFKKVTRLDKNVFTIDNACFKYDDSEYSEPLNLVRLQDEVFKHSGDNLFVKYEFTLENKINNLQIAVESIDAKEITVNGHIVKETKSHFIDKAIKVIDISDFQLIGTNEVVIAYKMERHDILNVEEIFETERNRFAYPVVIENIYVLGDFYLKLDKGEKTEMINFFSVSNPKFVISKPIDLDPLQDVTKQGNFFFRGNLSYETTIEFTGENTSVSLEKFDGVAVKLYVNNIYKDIIISIEDVDITDLLHEGLNDIRCELICSNRNTLGPHHHFMGEMPMTGVHTFKGERGFEDEFYSFYGTNPTWTDAYSFVRNNIGKLLLKKQIK